MRVRQPSATMRVECAPRNSTRPSSRTAIASPRLLPDYCRAPAAARRWVGELLRREQGPDNSRAVTPRDPAARGLSVHWAASMTPGAPQPDNRHASVRRYLAAVLATVVFILLRQSLEPWLPGQAPFLVLSAAPLLAAWYGGAGPGLLALAMCAVAGQLLFAQGHGGLPTTSEGWLRLGSFVVLATLSVWIIASRRTALERLQREHAELQALVARQREAEAELRMSQQRLQQLF